jgi:hypothetical protein
MAWSFLKPEPETDLKMVRFCLTVGSLFCRRWRYEVATPVKFWKFGQQANLCDGEHHIRIEYVELPLGG